jgi:dephospho-CoA kinase
MPAIGITGGISTGKSTFLGQLRELLPSAQYFDADRAARLLTDQDQDVRQAIRDAFGSQVFSGSGDLNRVALRAIILQSAAKRVALEQILHPRIRSQWSAEAQRYRNSSDFFFADIPLLYETGGETLCDRVVVIGCSLEVQLRRLLARRGSGEGKQTLMTENEAIEMIHAQMPLQEKIRRADHVIWNNGGDRVLAEQARDLTKLWLAKSWTVK